MIENYSGVQAKVVALVEKVGKLQKSVYTVSFGWRIDN